MDIIDENICWVLEERKIRKRGRETRIYCGGKGEEARGMVRREMHFAASDIVT